MNTRGSTKKRLLTEPDSPRKKLPDTVFDIDDDSDGDSINGIAKLTQEEITETEKNTNLDVVFDQNCFRTAFVAYKRQITNTAIHPMMASQKLCSRFRKYSKDEAIIHRKKQPMSKRDFLRLAQKDGWLSDQVITFFLINVIVERQKWIWNQKVATGMNMKRWYISTPYFFDKICPTKRANIPPWTFQLDEAMILHQRIDFTLYSGHLIPIHLNDNHFAVLKVDFSNMTITYIDSLVDTADKAQLIMDAYIRYYCEGRARITPTKTTPIAEHLWRKIILTSADVTQQQNNYDCGVYCAMYIDFTLLGFSLKWKESLATYYRRFMFNQIALYMRNFESSTS
jgi:Ulp1 family protease